MANRGPGFFGGQGLLRREYLSAEQRDANVWEERYAQQMQIESSSVSAPVEKQTSNGYYPTQKPGYLSQAASIGMDLIPVVGQVKAINELFTGRDPVTHQPISRWASALSLIPGAMIAGESFKAIRGGWRMLRPTTKEVVLHSSLSAANGAYGAFASGGDKVDVAWGAFAGGMIGVVGQVPGRVGSFVGNPYIASSLSNISGQVVSNFREPEISYYSGLSLLFTLFGTAQALPRVAAIDVPVTREMIMAMYEGTYGAMGAQLGRETGW